MQHFVYSSVGGAERNTAIPHWESKWEIEKHIRQLTLGELRQAPRFVYFPIGGGPRQRIGATFATTEAVLILATIARRYQLVSVDKTPVLPVPSITPRPKDPIPMRIEVRC